MAYLLGVDLLDRQSANNALGLLGGLRVSRGASGGAWIGAFDVNRLHAEDGWESWTEIDASLARQFVTEGVGTE